ncbi:MULTISPECIES: helix-turn-helix transcriptional regulator [Colwellia]|uniref:HTH-type transcriptional regulator y4mF n=1 Tax=Colwellia marinimaniae TaxID=1513592 RepID=A0ABQ0MRX5_9GAMM|nr:MULTISPECIES: helix-turn-helix transcriptional regulator [Colwellia]GAW95119.1 putative HTH-type transcriptional regulator y4mF [Colwellia marinimaniae]
MEIQIQSVKQLGSVSKLIRKSQGFDQATLGAFSSNGINFVSQFENGKTTVEIGRVLEVLDTLGIKLSIDIPIPHDNNLKRRLYKSLHDAGVNVEKATSKDGKNTFVMRAFQ